MQMSERNSLLAFFCCGKLAICWRFAAISLAESADGWKAKERKKKVRWKVDQTCSGGTMEMRRRKKIIEIRRRVLVLRVNLNWFLGTWRRSMEDFMKILCLKRVGALREKFFGDFFSNLCQCFMRFNSQKRFMWCVSETFDPSVLCDESPLSI